MPPRQRDSHGRFISASAVPEAEPGVPGSFDNGTGDGSDGEVTSQGRDSEETEETESVNAAADQASENSDSAETIRGDQTTRMAERSFNDFHTGEGASSSRTTDREAIPVYEGKPPRKPVSFDVEKLDRTNVKSWKNFYKEFLDIQDCWQVVELTYKWRKDPEMIRRLRGDKNWRAADNAAKIYIKRGLSKSDESNVQDIETSGRMWAYLLQKYDRRTHMDMV